MKIELVAICTKKLSSLTIDGVFVTGGMYVAVVDVELFSLLDAHGVARHSSSIGSSTRQGDLCIYMQSIYLLNGNKIRRSDAVRVVHVRASTWVSCVCYERQR
jgi:hypothetical protein